MEGIAHMVSASLARHGFATQVDHKRLQWSRWSRCESSFSVVLVPSKPGVFALAEEQAADNPDSERDSEPGLLSAFESGSVSEEGSGLEPGFVSGHRLSDAVTDPGSIAPLGAEAPRRGLDEKRTLTLFRISETEDLGMALGRLFLPSTPDRDRLSKKSCYVRYAVIEDEDQRHAGYRSLQQWMASPSQPSSEMPDNLAVHNFAVDDEAEGGDKTAA